MPQQITHHKSDFPLENRQGRESSDAHDSLNHDFLSIVSTQIANFLKIIPFMKDQGRDQEHYSKRFYEYVSSQAKLAEVFLDSCGAKRNRAWFFLRELVATIRCFGTVLYELRYLEIRTSSFENLRDDILEFQEE